jgi:hypothetical protein
MRKLLFCALFFLIAACSNNSKEQGKTEQLVKLYLDSLNHNSNNYQIVGYKHFHTIYSTLTTILTMKDIKIARKN